MITYTGYDMEDAMIINKMSYDRGFMQGSVVKQKVILAAPEGDSKSRSARDWAFTNVRPGARAADGSPFPLATNKNKTVAEHIERDGLPRIGARIATGDALCAAANRAGQTNIVHYKVEYWTVNFRASSIFGVM